MTDHRTWNRRESSVTPNGFFTILRPSRWFSARQPDDFHYLAGQPEGAKSPWAHDHPTENPPAAPTLQFVSLSAQDHHLMRTALIVLAAAAITGLLLLSLGQ
jgi:hypothetical protein